MLQTRVRSVLCRQACAGSSRTTVSPPTSRASPDWAWQPNARPFGTSWTEEAWELVAEFTEVESGKRADRPELGKALEACRRQKARLVIAKLDRLSRNVAFIAAVMESQVEFVAVDNPHANKLTVHILAAVAQHEREMISERTKAALQAARARGTKLEIRVSWRLPGWGGRHWPRLGSNLRQTCYPSFGIFRKAVPRAPTPSP